MVKQAKCVKHMAQERTALYCFKFTGRATKSFLHPTVIY